MDSNVKPALFGDPLGNAGDYAKGIYYQGRRKFLYNDGDDGSTNSMKPPSELMTNKQKKNSKLMPNTKGVELFQKIEFKRHAEAEAKALHLKHLEANRPRTKIVISTIPSSRDEWEHESQAGVSFWVHQTSGEVSMECPYDQTRPPTANLRAEQSTEVDADAEEGVEATGALVYDHKDYEEYLRLLGGSDEGQQEECSA